MVVLLSPPFYLCFHWWEDIPEPKSFISSTCYNCLQEAIYKTLKEEIAYGKEDIMIINYTWTNTWPSGDIARYNTLIVCPVRVATFPIDGYFHTIIWFWEYPCVLTSSFTFLLHARLQTWERIWQNSSSFSWGKQLPSYQFFTSSISNQNLASSVDRLQLVAICSIPESNASVRSSPTGCKKATLVRRPGDRLNCSRVLGQSQNRLLRMLVPYQQLLIPQQKLCY